jgi:fructose-bisphosphate aldolase class II/tagatose 1,6-diphosphate aldolase GatY/KbaY
VELIARCLDAGFDSVMIDASEKPFEDNIELTRNIVKMAEPYGVPVEAELGYVAKLGQSSIKKGFTQPGEAREFVSRTGVHALAVAIGSAHGFYKSTPELQMDLLTEIRQSTDAFLVLHGSSGIPDKNIQDAIRRGIVKVNLATEIKNIFIKTLKQELTNTEEIDLRKIFPPANQAITDLVKEKLSVVDMS